MNRFCPFIFVVLSLLPAVTRAQVNVTPQSAVLVLRNGNVIEGNVTNAGDYMIVSVGKSIIRLKTTDIEFLCRDLSEAYAKKAAGLDDIGARSHLDLAEWCLRHRLVDRAAEQVVAAIRIEPEHPRIAMLETRLKLAVEAPPPSSPAAEKIEGPSADDLDRVERELPKGSVEKFTSVVQPILFNRCATANCHGAGSASDFKLTKPPLGAMIQRRSTQRNLFAVLQQTNRSNPDESPLLVQPQRKEHPGGVVFDKQSRVQWEQLAAWTRQATTRPMPATPASIVQPVTHLSQPAEESSSSTGPSVTSTPKPAAAAAGEKSRSPVPEGKFIPRDPFDPEIFNRRMHAERFSGTPSE